MKLLLTLSKRLKKFASATNNRRRLGQGEYIVFLGKCLVRALFLSGYNS